MNETELQTNIFLPGDLVTLVHDDFVGINSAWLGRDGFVISTGDYMGEPALLVGLLPGYAWVPMLIEAPQTCFAQSENVVFKYGGQYE